MSRVILIFAVACGLLPVGYAQFRPGPSPSQEVISDWKKWFNEDVAYLLVPREREAFLQLVTDDERSNWAEQFWFRRDPTPATEENEYKEEHYRRIAFANEHFASKVPGWKTDRGRVYIVWGPPDEIDSHLPGREVWRFTSVNGLGKIEVEFADLNKTGELRLLRRESMLKQLQPREPSEGTPWVPLLFKRD